MFRELIAFSNQLLLWVCNVRVLCVRIGWLVAGRDEA